jgi:hypothetical protein
MPYLDNFIHTDNWNDEMDNALIQDNKGYGQPDDMMSSVEDFENNAYLYELEMVLDEDDDFFIG